MTCKKNTLFNKKKAKRVKRLLPKIESICNSKSTKDMKSCLNGLDELEMEFIAECLYNVIFNAENILSFDQISFLQTIMRKTKRNAIVSLYRFVFQKLKSDKKIVCCCKAFHVIVFVFSMLLPIFKNVL